MFPVLARLGGSLSVALNALNLVPAAGGGMRFLLSRLADSLDATSVIEGCLALSL